MTNAKRILALVLVCVMLIPMGISSFAAAMSVDTTVAANWTAMAAKYNKGTWTPFAPASNNYQLKTDNFTFKNVNGGIQVYTPTYSQLRAGYGTSVLSSKATTQLDGLTVAFTADEFDSMVDTAGAGNSIGVIWSEAPITEVIGGYNATDNTWSTGNYTAALAYKSGLRNLIPFNKDQEAGIPASDKNATPEGQALYIGVNIKKQQADLAPIADSIDIVYYDGQYINKNDGQVGYRWTFTARNHPDTPNSDYTACSVAYDDIDLRNGLTVNVRADDVLGYIVNINGIDYYKGTDVGYFPDANVNGYSQTYNITESLVPTENYLSTMTAAQADIDLSGLKTATKGYVTVGAVSINDTSSSMYSHRCTYTVKSINGVAAANWAGQANTCAHSYAAGWTQAANCTQPGGDFYKCTKCGAIEIRNKVEATGHTLAAMVEEMGTTCFRGGLKSQKCTVCNCRPVVESIPMIDHTWGEWTVTTEPTETEPGVETRACTFVYTPWNEKCTATETREIPATGTPVDPDVPTECTHEWGEWVVTVEPTETTAGVETRTCTLCGATEDQVVPKTGKDWKIIFDPDGGVMPEGVALEYGINTGDNYKEATGIDYPVPTMDGYLFAGWYWDLYAYTLTEGDWNDGYFAVAMDVPVVALWEEDPNWVEPDDGTPKIVGFNNYTVTMKNITNIKEIRFAIGHYTTGTQIKNAEKNVTLSASVVKNYTVDGVMTYDLPWVGEYTFWVRLNDGSQYWLYDNLTEINPYVTSYGVKLTVNDFGENYKDAWLAKGTFNSYSEIKASTAFKYQASATKLGNYAKTTHDFTYTMTDPGDYTVLIRYNDGTFDVIHHELTVTTPVLVENGLQAIITNIPDIKIIRTAYGHHTSVESIKKAATVRYFNNKTAIKDAEQYMIQYRNEGEVTIIVEYNDGYKHYFYYNVAKKVPTVTQNGDTVTFGNLDDLYIIRYAAGKYTTANNIKNAPNAQYKKLVNANENGEIVI
ncbi:MAG: hypothetical protein IKT46_07995, partial [Clostridia bacterium]|nr:hypothetical protein [Clostridia bacterium]